MTLDRIRTLPPVHFVFPGLAGSHDAALADPPPEADALHERLIDGTQAWILHTYLRLRPLGLRAHLVPGFEPEGIHVCHYDTLQQLGAPANAFIVGVRGDRAPLRRCEMQIVQTSTLLGASDVHLIGHWPQPGLLPRDPARGTRVERIAFFGFGVNLDPAYRSPAFRDRLRKANLELVERLAGNWNDYRDLDLVLAVRNLPRVFQNTKPATKLVNAWLAGCPALLGPEPAYRSIGTPGVDYLEVSSPAEALSALESIQSSPELYTRLQRTGRERAREHDMASVARQWFALLDGPVREAHARWSRPRLARSFRLEVRRSAQTVRQWIEHKTFWSLAHGERILRGHATLGG